MPVRIAIDRGGTFTDVFAESDGREMVFKLLSVDPANYEDAPTEGIRRVLENVTGRPIPKTELLDLEPVESIRMGTTVATNALLERKGDNVAFFVTKGFKDILKIGQQARPAIFDLTVAKLGHLYEKVYEIDERITLEQFSEDPQPKPIDTNDPAVTTGVSGEHVRILKKPDEKAARLLLQDAWNSGIRSVAIAFLHSYIYPEHELAIARIAKEVGFENVSISSQIQPMIKIVARANSSTADAYLSPITTRYIEKIGSGFKGGLEAAGGKLLFMQSDGGLAKWSEFSGLRAILSGPAGGVVGYAKTSYQGEPVLGFDMGGTSTDVSRFNGSFDHVFETTTAEVTVQAPQLDIQTVAAGGGSILAWKRGLFQVGPESASAHPGPACYRKGGPLTVTDANLFLGRIDVASFPHIFGPGEDEPLDADIVQKKFKELAQDINAGRDGAALSPEEVAVGFLQVANEAMTRPIRAMTEGKGHTVSKHVLASFGGAGGQHACDVAINLGISKVIIHRYSSILSAYGMALADVVVDLQQPESITLTDSELPQIQSRLDKLAAEARQKLESQGFKASSIRVEKYLNLHFKGSETLIMVLENDKSSYAVDFTEKHRTEFGFTLDRPIRVGDIRVRAIAQQEVAEEKLLPKVLKSSRPLSPQKRQKIYFTEWVEGGVYHLKDLGPGDLVKGPAMILDETQTIVVTPESEATIGEFHVVIDIKESKKDAVGDTEINPVLLSVFGHRFMSIAEQMGKTLQHTAISTNIKERLDFSCALFSPDGGLVANAPHIPIHLGSMSSAVAYQHKKHLGKLRDGDVLMANHPAYGGSHLPDITVITPVFDENGKTIIFWVASRGHHSDIGGITAGSMPPFSNFLWQEGAMIESFKVVSAGKFDLDGVVKLLYDDPAQYPGCSGSRSLQDSISDLKAQIAANNKGIALIKALAQELGLKVVQLYMQGIRDNAEHSVRTMLRSIAEEKGTKLHAVDYIDDGTPIELTVTIDKEQGSAVFDFAGTGSQIYGNLNAPHSITYSAILYSLRSMITDDIPLNQGCLNPLTVKIPDGSLLSPGPEAACVGGNVETSQRITDVVLHAFGALAGSQGTCNNFTFGFGGKKNDDGTVSKGFGYYETIAGGAGAGPTWHGQSGVQVHMTNTRSTDAEIFEKRYPVILHEFALREGSGGGGKFNGGEGVIRDIEFTHVTQVSILSERRARPPYGLDGGEPGAPGINYLVSGDRKVSIGGKNTLEVQPGERVVINTPGGGGYGRRST